MILKESCESLFRTLYIKVINLTVRKERLKQASYTSKLVSLLLWPPLCYGISHKQRHKGSFKGIALGISAMPCSTILCHAGWVPSFALCHSSIQFVCPPPHCLQIRICACHLQLVDLLPFTPLLTNLWCNDCSLLLSSSQIPIELSLLLLPLNFFPPTASALNIGERKRLWWK